MDLNQLAVFVRVVDSGSFTKAATLLRQPKSRVSRRIAGLEKELGVQLIYRSTRQFSLTDAGRELYDQAKNHVYALEGASRSVTETKDVIAGRLRITAPEDLGTVVLSPFLIQLGRDYPRLKVELTLTNDFLDLVKDGIDLAIRIGSLKDTSFKKRSLGGVRLILVAGPDYLKRQKKILQLEDLKNHQALVFSQGQADGEWRLTDRKGKTQRLKVQGFRSSNNPQIALRAALAGQGVALLPEFLCQPWLDSGELKQVLPQLATSAIPVQMIWPAGRETSPNLRLFLDTAAQALKSQFTELP